MVIIEGVAFPLDFLNKNGWGVPSSDAGCYMTSTVTKRKILELTHRLQLTVPCPSE
ncbi:hypothetical protein [Methanomethylovorans hollandica]|uniref:hypothetical protein n=1 Tax=Methanomethylovorans hollandica TaxID=101192 RepID=UPI0012E9DF35|nr:hypothetical protein [Methanomethylovorans hollandica]